MSPLQPVIDLMEIAARTAPKSGGKDFVVIQVIEDDDLKRLADEMIKSFRCASKEVKRTAVGPRVSTRFDAGLSALVSIKTGDVFPSAPPLATNRILSPPAAEYAKYALKSVVRVLSRL